MPRLATFQLKNGTAIFVEVDDQDEIQRTMRGVSAPAELVVKANETFEAALDTIKQAAESMVDRLCSLAKPADELSIEFNVKLSAEAGAVIARASSEANFKIGLKWVRTLTPVD